MPARFLSTRNDLKLVAIYMVIILLLGVGVEFALTQRPEENGDEGGGGSTPPPGEGGQGTDFFYEDIELDRAGQTNEGQTSTEEFSLNYEMVTSVELVLSWEDDYGSNDRFSISFSREGEALSSDEGATGSLTLNAADEQGNLTGAFQVEIKAVDCPGTVDGIPVDRDDGNTWQLHITATVGTETQEGV